MALVGPDGTAHAGMKPMIASLARWLQALPTGVLVGYMLELRGFDASRRGMRSAITVLRAELQRRAPIEAWTARLPSVLEAPGYVTARRRSERASSAAEQRRMERAGRGRSQGTWQAAVTCRSRAPN